jgi:hypothetical protein
MFKNWQTVAVTGLALVGGYFLLQRYGGVSGLVNVVVKGDPIAIQRFNVGAKAQAEASKAAALGGPKALADDNASRAMVKS